MSSKSQPQHRISSNLAKYYSIQVGCTSFRIDTRYQNLFLQGDESFDCVASAFDTIMNRRVSIKKIRSPLSELHHLKRILREVILLRHFITHENVVSIYDIMTDPPDVPDFEDIYIVTNLFETDLEKIIGSNENNLTDHHLQFFMYQILRGLKFIHSANVIHRDLKPSNMLVNSSCDLAICDFGLGRGLNSIYENPLTQYVVTRYYRAPELLCESSYGKPIDIWSVGCIFAEMITRAPFFTGENPQEQLKCIVHKLGIPPKEKLNFIKSRAALNNILSSQTNAVPHFAMNFPNGTSFLALDLIRQMLEINPSERITVEDALKHPYLKNFHDLVSEPVCQNIFNFNFDSSSQLSNNQSQSVIRQVKKFRSDETVISNAEAAIGETLAKAFMTSVFGKTNVMPPKSTGGAGSMSISSSRYSGGQSLHVDHMNNHFDNQQGINMSMNMGEGFSARMSNASTDREASDSSNEFHRMRKLTNDQISIREAKFLILQEVKIYRKLSPAINNFLAKESNTHLGRNDPSMIQSTLNKGHNASSMTGSGPGPASVSTLRLNNITSVGSSSLQSQSSNNLNMFMNGTHVVSPRTASTSTGYMNMNMNSSQQNQNLSNLNSPRDLSSSSMYAPNNFFVNQYALSLGSNSNMNDHSRTGDRSLDNITTIDIDTTSNRGQNSYSSNSFKNDFSFSHDSNKIPMSLLSNKQMNEPATLSENTDNQSIFSSNDSRCHINGNLNPNPVSSSNPVPNCENFQWIANGNEDEGHDVDLLFDEMLEESMDHAMNAMLNSL